MGRKRHFERVRIQRFLQGAILGFGAPFGWLLLSDIFSLLPGDANYEVYLFTYMALGTIAVFASFGFVVGRHEQKLSELSLMDPLTRLYNHRYFHDSLHTELARSVRYSTELSLLIGDIDFFKKVNDTYGHPAGDVVLQAVAGMLDGASRDSDVVARVGGEEFAVLLPSTDIEGAVQLAERMRALVQNTAIKLPDGRVVNVTISIGASALHRNDLEIRPTHLYDNADAALYRAKENGRNMVVASN